MKLTTIVIDDFLDNPDAVRKSALELDFYESGQFPGKRSDRPDKEYEDYIKNKIESVTKLDIKEWSMDSFRFQIVLEGEETWIHRDPSEWAGIIYLTPNALLESGTGIYNEEEQLEIGVGNVYNRLIIYPGDVLHRSILPGFGDSKETGRLTQVLFFRTGERDV
jgi:hypothetical protein